MNKTIFIPLLMFFCIIIPIYAANSCDATNCNFDTCTGLQAAMNGNCTKNFNFTANIDCAGIAFTDSPCRTSAFTKNIYGNGFTISNLSITASNVQTGFVGQCTGINISNLFLTNYLMNSTYGAGMARVGGICGYGSIKLIENVSITNGNVRGYDRVGGIIGEATATSTISRVAFRGKVFDNTHTEGGLLGFDVAQNSIVKDSYFIGNVTGGNNQHGGLVGQSYAGTVINRSYFIGAVTGNYDAGGLSGYSGRIDYSFAISNVTCPTNAGGLMSRIGTGSISNSYWYNYTGDSANRCYITGDTGCTINNTFEWYKSSSNNPMATWNFTDVWSINSISNNGYPFLKFEGLVDLLFQDFTITTPRTTSITNRNITGNATYTGAGTLTYAVQSVGNTTLANCSIDSSLGLLNITVGTGYGTTNCTLNVTDGTISDSSLVTITVDFCYSTICNLNNCDNLYDTINDNCNKIINLTTDIDCTGVSWSESPCKAGYSGKQILGNNYEIINLTIGCNSDYCGFIARGDINNKPNITNIGFTGLTINQNLGRSVGSIVGESANLINNSYVVGGITAYYPDVLTNVGGLIGKDVYLIQNSYFIGGISASGGYGVSSVGGLVGYDAKNIKESYANGTVTSNQGSGVGGIVGSTSYNITNVYFNGSVTGNKYVGGITGSTSENIINSYVIGGVNGVDSYYYSDSVGGIVGSNSELINNSFFVGAVSKSYYGSTFNGGAVGSTSTLIENFWWNNQTDDANDCVGNPADNMGCTIESNTSWYKDKNNEPLQQWDFINIWTLNSLYNEGYPFFISTTPTLSIPDQTLNKNTPAALNLSLYTYDTDSTIFNYSILSDNTSQVDCEIDNALITDGNTSYVSVPFNQTINATDTDYTVSVWAKRVGGSSGTFGNILGRGASTKRNYMFYWTDATSRMTFVVSNSTGFPGITPTTVLRNNTWYMFTGTYDATTKNLSVYINGTYISQTTTGDGIFTDNDAIDIGKSSYGSVNYFNGSIDEISIYKRKLSAGEISNLFTRGLNHLPNNNSNTSIGGYWTFDTNGSDSSGNGNTGTLYGNATIGSGNWLKMIPYTNWVGTTTCNINVTDGSHTSNQILNIIVNQTDTCTYGGSGLWSILCSDNCQLNTNTNLVNNNISMTGFGNVTLSANLSNVKNLFINGNNETNKCIFTIRNGRIN